MLWGRWSCLKAKAQGEANAIINSSPVAQLMVADVRLGTHLACMGTDTRGKQEVDPALVARTRLFTDDVADVVSFAEVQHAVVALAVSRARGRGLGFQVEV